MRYFKIQVALVLAVLLVGIAPVNADSTTVVETPLTITKIEATSISRSWSDVELIYQDQWHDPVHLEEEMDQFNEVAPAIIDLEIIGQTYQGRNITCVIITNEQSTYQKAKTVVVAHHHGREQITVEMALRFIARLINGYGVDPVITEYIDTEEIFVIPSLNQDALQRIVHNDDFWLRKNLRPFDDDGDGLLDEDPYNDVDLDGQISSFDIYEKPGYYVGSYFEGIDDDGDGQVNEDEIGHVDLNRNYPVFWGDIGASSETMSQTYHGPNPFSENETMAFRDFAVQHSFAMAYSLHSGINATYLPSNEDNIYPLPSLYHAVLDDYENILPDSFFSSGYYPSGGARVEAGPGGLWKEWMYYSRQTTLPVCFELYHNPEVDGEDAVELYYENATHYIEKWTGIYGFFNPVESKIEQLWQEITPAFDYLLEMLPRLDISVNGGVQSETSVAFNMTMTNLSPRLGSKSTIDIYTAEGQFLYGLGVMSADSTYNGVVGFNLPSTFVGNSLTIKIGNEYSGYAHFEISGISGRTSDLALPTELILAAGIGLVIVAAIVILVVRRR